MTTSSVLRKASVVAVLLVAWVVSACGGGTSDSPTPPPPAAPVISSFTATPSTITSGSSSTLAWSVSGATSVSISQGVGAVTGSSTTVSPTSTTTYTLTATNSGGSATAAAMVTVSAAPPAPVASVAVSLAASSVTLGQTTMASAVLRDASSNVLTGRTLAWASASNSVATVDSNGLVTTTGIGTSVITATSEGISGSATVTVTAVPLVPVAVAVTPATSDVIAAGAAVALTARATYSDSSTVDVSSQATWTTSDAGLVVVSASGSATAPATALVGSIATVTASFAGLHGSSALRVVRAAAYGPDLSNDPLITQQWYIRNTGQAAYADNGGVAGQDLKLATAWSLGVTGKGVKVAIVDDGLQTAHEDLSDNMVPGSWNFLNKTADPSPDAPGDNHGTAVAGITAMVYGNAKGGAGVAPRASLNGYNVIADASPMPVEWFQKALGGSSSNPTSNDVWVFNQSYGTSTTRPHPVNPVIEDQYAAGTQSLRLGRGALYVKSAGNDFQSFRGGDCTAANALPVTCQNASLDGNNTLPYNVVVGALGAKGKRASYSTAGSALWASATGGETGSNASVSPAKNPGTVPPSDWPATEFEAAMVTSDRMNCTVGYAENSTPVPTEKTFSSFDRGASPNTPCNYTNSMNGTSSAAPSTTGVIALLLEARPELTWREVKHLLARTGRKVDPDILAVPAALSNGTYVAELPWTTNRAGYNFHNWYGFGAVDASAALEAARTFTLGSLGTFENTGWIASAAGLALGIPDNSVTGISSTLTVTGSLVVEAVQIDIAFTHMRPGDVGIELTSPSGSKSILLNIRNGMPPAVDVPTSNVQGIFLSNLFYGEPSIGVWTVKLVDGVAGVTGTIDQWKIRVYGHK